MAEFRLAPIGSAERDGTHSWDIFVDGRTRSGVPMTLIFDPGVGLIVWVHYAPPLADYLRRVYRQLLRWNDQLPHVKFGLGSEDQPVLSVEVPLAHLDRDALGLAVARLLATCDLLYAESAAWVDRISKAAAGAGPAGVELLDRYASQLAELTSPE